MIKKRMLYTQRPLHNKKRCCIINSAILSPRKRCNSLPYAYEGVHENALVQFIETSSCVIEEHSDVLMCENGDALQSAIDKACEDFLIALRAQKSE